MIRGYKKLKVKKQKGPGGQEEQGAGGQGGPGAQRAREPSDRV
jgi:hypothetical protein